MLGSKATHDDPPFATDFAFGRLFPERLVGHAWFDLRFFVPFVGFVVVGGVFVFIPAFFLIHAKRQRRAPDDLVIAVSHGHWVCTRPGLPRRLRTSSTATSRTKLQKTIAAVPVRARSKPPASRYRLMAIAGNSEPVYS